MHNLYEMRLNESLYKLLVPIWNKDQTNEKMKSVGFPVHSSFIYTALRQQNWNNLIMSLVTSGEEMWTELTISHISLLDLCIMSINQVPIPLLDFLYKQL